MSCKLGYRLFLHTISSVSAIFNNDWTRDVKKMKRLCYNFNSVEWKFSTSVNRIQYSVYKMEVERVCKIELNTVCTVRDSTRWIEWKVQHEVFTQLDTVCFDGNSTEIQHACSTKFNRRCVQLNSTRRGECKLNSDCIKWKVLLLHCTPLHFTLSPRLHFTLLHFTLFAAFYTVHFSVRSTLDTSLLSHFSISIPGSYLHNFY